MDGMNKYDGTGVKTGHAWNERTVDTIPYVSIEIYISIVEISNESQLELLQ